MRSKGGGSTAHHECSGAGLPCIMPNMHCEKRHIYLCLQACVMHHQKIHYDTCDSKISNSCCAKHKDISSNSNITSCHIIPCLTCFSNKWLMRRYRLICPKRIHKPPASMTYAPSSTSRTNLSNAPMSPRKTNGNKVP